MRVDISQAATPIPLASLPEKDGGGLGWPQRPFKVSEWPPATYQKFLLIFMCAFRVGTAH